MPFKKPHQTADPSPDNIKWDNNINGYVIKPKGLNIIWGNDLRYWKMIHDGNYAELIQVSWLEVSGKLVEKVKRGETYAVKFHVEVKPNGFGWGNTEVLVMAKIGKKGQYKYKSVKLYNGRIGTIPEDNDELIINVGDNGDDLELHFGLYEVWSGKWKGGLVIKKAEVIKKS